MPWSIAARSPSRGSDQQTNDKAKFQGQYYSDKLPGFSLLATVPYAIARSVLRLPSHPLNQSADPFRYWAADYWVTLGTSGLFTAGDGCPARAVGPRAGLFVRGRRA